jgi:hypothetical protein
MSALRVAQAFQSPVEISVELHLAAGYSSFQGCLNAHDLQYWLAVETQGFPAVA